MTAPTIAEMGDAAADIVWRIMGAGIGEVCLRRLAGEGSAYPRLPYRQSRSGT
jgi:hypothetical protein